MDNLQKLLKVECNVYNRMSRHTKINS